MRFLRNHSAWSSLAKGGVATALLFGVAALSFSWWALVLFVLALGVGYLKEPPRRRVVRVSFVFAAGCGVAGLALSIAVLPPAVAGWFIVAILAAHWSLFAILFFLAGTTNPRRDTFYGVANTALLTSVYLLFFGLNESSLSSLSFVVQVAPLAVFLGTLLLVRETIAFEGTVWGRRTTVLAAAAALAAVEVSTILLFLPLGFVNAAILLSLVILLIRDGLIAHLGGIMDVRMILR
ncbi:MAG: hypothetical protein AAB601_02775, partial [Patescibacteria group bacterium]